MGGIVFVFSFLLFNFWWIFPYILNLSNTSEIRSSASAFSAVSISNVKDVITQFGSWAFTEKPGKYFYFPYNVNYFKFPLVIIKYLPFLLSCMNYMMLVVF